VRAVDVETAIRTRRTQKAFGPEPVGPAVLEELFALARWAPNHFLTEPWRFRVLGPATIARLAAAGGPGELEKLTRAATLVVATVKLNGDPYTEAEDRHATACAVYALLLAAHARGLASYWRTPKLLREPAGRDAVGIEADEELVALIHLGTPVSDPSPKERKPVSEIALFLP
jgi:nitroreductase